MSVLKDPKVIEKIEAVQEKAVAKGRKEAEKELKATLKEFNDKAKARDKEVQVLIKAAITAVKEDVENKDAAKQCTTILKDLLIAIKNI